MEEANRWRCVSEMRPNTMYGRIKDLDLDLDCNKTHYYKMGSSVP